MSLCPKCKFEWKSTIRSTPQNRYYFGVVIDILSNHIGFTPDEMHEILKHKFLRHKEQKGYVIPQSTTSLSTIEFENYLTQIREWAVIDLGVLIPEPNEEIPNEQK